MKDEGKRTLLGVKMSCVDYDAAVGRIIAAAGERQPLSVSALAVHGVMTGVLDREQRYRLNQFDLLTPDGQPVRWALNWLHGARLPDRVSGPMLMLRVCEKAAEADLAIYLFGGTPEIAGRLRDSLSERFPRLRIAGAEPSRFRRLTAEERSELVKRVRGSGASIVFVGLGCPRQEVWAYELRDDLGCPLLAVGAAFPLHARLIPQAPEWMQRAGLEWLFRLAQEPRRLWKRYLYLNPAFLVLVAMQALRLFAVSSEGAKPDGAMNYG